MIELIQIPWSPFCLVQRRILQYGRVRHKVINVPPNDRSLVWRLTRQRYYQVPIIRHGRSVMFEVDDNSQVIAKYLSTEFGLDLFPPEREGIQKIIWRYIENDVELTGFKLNDIHYLEFVPAAHQLNYLRFKERKFGRNCFQQWRDQQEELLAALTRSLLPFEQMLKTSQFLLDDRPCFVDFDLWGMLDNFLYSGRNALPAVHPRLQQWYQTLTHLKRHHRS